MCRPTTELGDSKLYNLVCGPIEHSDTPGQSSLGALWVASVPMILHIEREGSDQTVDAQAYKCLHRVDMPSCTFN